MENNTPAASGLVAAESAQHQIAVMANETACGASESSFVVCGRGTDVYKDHAANDVIAMIRPLKVASAAGSDSVNWPERRRVASTTSAMSNADQIHTANECRRGPASVKALKAS